MRLHSFPIFVDPAAQALEIQVESGEALRWSVLYRLQVRHDTFDFALNPAMIHFFGLSEDVAQCPFVIIYDSTGTLRYWIFRQQQGQKCCDVLYPLPEELTGHADVRVSVRLAFPSDGDALAFRRLVLLLQRGATSLEEREMMDELRELLLKADSNMTRVSRLPKEAYRFSCRLPG